MERAISRRGFVAGSAALAASPLLARGVGAQATPSPDAEAKLEIFSWWTSGGEAAGLDQLFNAFKATNPNVEIVNAAVAGGAAAPAEAAEEASA